jgi:hypothetical protein
MAETGLRRGDLRMGWGLLALLLAIGFATFMAGCGGGGGGTTTQATPTITSVAVGCSPASILPSQTSTCTPTVSGTGGYRCPDAYAESLQ